MTTKKLKSGTYFIKGAKWWDRINGNTYFSAYIMDQNGNIINLIRYQYGYGTEYYHTAVKWINENKRKNSNIKIVDMGAQYHAKQKNVKNWLY